MGLHLQIHNILQNAASKYPRQIAAEDTSGNKLSYSDLNEDAEKIKDVLIQNRLSTGTRIGILLPKSLKCLSLIYGILKSGSAYVPLDSKAPILRNAGICKDCQLQALFIEKKAVTDFFLTCHKTDSYKEIEVSTGLSLLIFESKKEISSEELAYILYTSGSTGSPKGVKHTHKSALAFIEWCFKQFAPTSADRIASLAPFHFDLSVFDLYVSAMAGSTLLLLDERIAANPLLLAETLSEKEVNILYATPSALSHLCAFGKMQKHNFKRLRLVLFAGEVFPISNLKKLKEILPGTVMYNLYGPTETNVCTWFKIPSEIDSKQTEPFPIGKTCPYAEYKIVSETGELLISCASLTCGYWNDDSNTKKVFETDSGGKTWYHTGDVVSLNKENDLVYLGRIDRMVKRKSYRIEPEEIENQLRKFEPILEAAVTTESKNHQTDTVITAHIVWREGHKMSSLDIINYCNTVLPVYMLPDNFKFHPALPKTSTGKINYTDLSQEND